MGWGVPGPGTSGGSSRAGRAGSCQLEPLAVGCSPGAGPLRSQHMGQGWALISRVHRLFAVKCDRGVCIIQIFHLFQRHFY